MVEWIGRRDLSGTQSKPYTRRPNGSLNGPMRVVGGLLSFPDPNMGLVYPGRSLGTPCRGALISPSRIPSWYIMAAVNHFRCIVHSIARQGGL